MKFQVLTGALLCIECNVDVQRCNLVFVASGQQISGMIIEPIGSVAIQQSFVQFRISSMNSSGLTNVVNESSLKFVISQCKLAGSNLIQSASNGYIASAILAHISLNVTQFDICVDSTSRFGQNSVSVSMIGSETVKCDLCHDQSVVYGLCSEDLKFSENVNGMYQCPHPFEYVDNQCVCVTGYLLNNTKCIDVVEALNAIGNLIGSSSNNQIQLLEQKVDTIENSLILVDQSISSNISELENRILSNYSKSDNNLLINTSTLDNRIYQNISLVNNDILMKQIIADSNLFSNTTVLDWRIFNNFSKLLNNMNNFKVYYNDSLLIEQLFQQVCGRRLIELRGLFYVINFVETKQCQACQYFHFANNQQNSRKRLQPFNRQITIFVFNIYQNILFVFQITLFIFYKCVCTLLCHFIHQYAFYNTLDTNDILCTNTHICYYIICSRHITHLLLYIHDSVYMLLLLVLQLGLLLVGYNLQFFVVQLQFLILLDLFSFNQLCFQHNPLFQFLYILDAIISSKKTHQLILLTQNQLLMVMQKVENFNHDIYKIKICEITLLNVRICKFSWYSQRTT
ncbi:Hypothetical_protein [Hexamita inflata]|uniref:Hypothetical_protein n=1 Tax=Hexamita inflata TaxID=28002 RepID=A0AA86QED9_9EUKA|nr:Hypothetical protein HINF_LOCUS42941 [Hexamita inflata]